MNSSTTRRGLAAAAVVDLALAGIALVPMRSVTDLLSIPIGEPTMHFRFGGLMFGLLAIFYALGAARRDLAPAIAAAATGCRIGGIVFLVAHLAAGAPRGYFVFLAVEAVFAAIHPFTLRRDGLGFVEAFRRPIG